MHKKNQYYSINLNNNLNDTTNYLFNKLHEGKFNQQKQIIDKKINIETNSDYHDNCNKVNYISPYIIDKI